MRLNFDFSEDYCFVHKSNTIQLNFSKFHQFFSKFSENQRNQRRPNFFAPQIFKHCPRNAEGPQKGKILSPPVFPIAASKVPRFQAKKKRRPPARGFNPFQNLAAGVATKVRAPSSSPYFFPVRVLAHAIKSGFPPSSLAGSGSNLMEAAGFGMP
jgi:hypothetical protein